MMKRLLTISVLLCTCALESSPVAASESLAKERFFEGLERLEASDLENATKSFEASFEAYPNVNCLENLAMCYFKLNRLFDALSAFEKLEQQFSGALSPESKKRATDKIKEIKKRLPSLSISSFPEGATVFVDGKERGTTPLALPIFVSKGTHKIELRKSGYTSQVKTADYHAPGVTGEMFTLISASRNVRLITKEPRPTVHGDNFISTTSMSSPSDEPLLRYNKPLMLVGLFGSGVMAGVSGGLWGGTFIKANEHSEKNAQLKRLDQKNDWDKSIEKQRDDARAAKKVFHAAAVATSALTGVFIALSVTELILKLKENHRRESAFSWSPNSVTIRF